MGVGGLCGSVSFAVEIVSFKGYVIPFGGKKKEGKDDEASERQKRKRNKRERKGKEEHTQRPHNTQTSFPAPSSAERRTIRSRHLRSSSLVPPFVLDVLFSISFLTVSFAFSDR